MRYQEKRTEKDSYLRRMLEWFRSNFLDGLTISSGYVVASETVVNKEVSKKTLIVEGPAKSVKELEE